MAGETTDTIETTEVVEETVETTPETVEETTPETTEETTEETTPETTEEGSDDEEEDIPEIDFEEEKYVVGGYDLSKFKDRIVLEEAGTLEGYLAEAKEMGFTQEQIDWIISKEIGEQEADLEKKEKPLTNREKKAILDKQLTLEEKRNYKPAKTFLTERLANNEKLLAKVDEIMENPALVSLVNEIFKGENAKGATGKLNPDIPKRTEKNIARNLSVQDAQAELTYAMQTGGDIGAIVKEHLGKVNDPEVYKQILKAMGKSNLIK